MRGVHDRLGGNRHRGAGGGLLYLCGEEITFGDRRYEILGIFLALVTGLILVWRGSGKGENIKSSERLLRNQIIMAVTLLLSEHYQQNINMQCIYCNLTITSCVSNC